MAGRFFITGLPRSRTAWLSVATSTRGAVCYHEPTQRFSSFEALASWWKPSFGIDMGVSDSALAIQTGRILKEIGPKTLIVRRDIEECIASFSRYISPLGYPLDLDHCRGLAAESLRVLEAVSDNPLVKSVEFDALSDMGTVRDCLNWLLPYEEFPDLEQMMTMNIQVNLSETARTMRIPHTGWHREAA